MSTEDCKLKESFDDYALDIYWKFRNNLSDIQAASDRIGDASDELYTFAQEVLDGGPITDKAPASWTNKISKALDAITKQMTTARYAFAELNLVLEAMQETTSVREAEHRRINKEACSDG